MKIINMPFQYYEILCTLSKRDLKEIRSNSRGVIYERYNKEKELIGYLLKSNTTLREYDLVEEEAVYGEIY